MSLESKKLVSCFFGFILFSLILLPLSVLAKTPQFTDFPVK